MASIPDNTTSPTTALSVPASTEEPIHTPDPAPQSTDPSPEDAGPVGLLSQLWDVAKAHGHPEIWGVTLADPKIHIPTQIVLQKYLNANDGDVVAAKSQLTSTLDWRAKVKPLELVKKAFNRTKFGNLGFVTVYLVSENQPKEIFNWNIYGGVKSIDETFGDLGQFLEWRVAIMELALAELELPTATKAITASDDPYKITQVHDYKSISFLRQSPHVKAASTETIKVFAQNYPELLKEKFFLNVPVFMGFMYALIKPFLAPKTVKKFHPMTNGSNLAREFAWGDQLPNEYGGKGTELQTVGKETLLSGE